MSITNRRSFLLGVGVAAGVVGTAGTLFFANDTLLNSGGDLAPDAANDRDIPDDYDPDLCNYLARCWRRPSASTEKALDNLFRGLKETGLWHRFDALWDLQAETRARAILNLKGTGNDLIVEGEMVQNGGFGLTGDGQTGHARTGLVPAGGNLRFQLDSGSIGIFCTVNSNGGENYAIGTLDGNLRLKTRQVPADAPSGYLNDTLFPLTGPAGSGRMPGLSIISRSASGTVTLYKNERKIAAAGRRPENLYNGEIFIGRAGSRFSRETYAFAFVGGELAEEDVSNFVRLLRDYLTQAMHPVVCYGDSLTQGVRNMGKSPTAIATSWPARLGDYLSRPVYNAGVSGEKSFEIRKRALEDSMLGTAVHVIWAGRNNYDQYETVLDDIAKIISHAGHSKYVVLSVLNGFYPSEAAGKPGYEAIVRLNAELAKRYSENYLDIRSILLRAGDTSVQTDRENIDAGIVPLSLRSDSVHLNDTGDGVVSRAVADFILAKGW